ncbi:MAG: ATP synthase F1 subunit delta [Candidatus Cyclobacteriaceae bacterium M2_1C_046]
MSDNRVAKRYAKSLLELADERKVLDAVNKDMQNFSEVVSENRDLMRALKSPIVGQDKKKAIIHAVFADVHEMTRAIFDIIIKKNRAEMLPEIANEFHRQYNLLLGIQVAHITTATPLNEKLRKEFISLIKQISGKDKIQLEEDVNDKIIGGFILTVGDRQIDDSINSKLNVLRRDLTKNQYLKRI